MTFKPKFSGKPATTTAAQGKADWKDRPFKVLKYKAEGDEGPTLMAFLSENAGKFGTYFSGAEIVLDDDGKPAKGADGKTKKTETKYFFDPKQLKLKAKVGEETTVICEMKPSKFGEGSFFGTNEDKVSFYLDVPKKK